jgi:hypothetical protein
MVKTESVTDQWASAFEDLADILKPYNVTNDKIACKNWIRKHIHDFKDRMTEEKYAESLRLISIIHI